MTLTPEKLAMAGYRPLESFDYKTDLVVFVQRALKQYTPVTIAYIVINLILLGNVGLRAGLLIGEGWEKGRVFGHVSYGFAIPFLLIPLHEWLHGLAYRRLGATKISYEANWRQFHFAALADRFVVSRREFWFVAFTPFLVLTAAFIGIALLLPPLWSLTLWTAALLHAALCGGDFGLASFFWENRHRDVVTFDDVTAQRVYFYERPTAAAVKSTAGPLIAA